jgi:glucokinase
MIVAGDVGGTKVHLALYGFKQGKLVHVRDERFPAAEFTGLEDIVRRFISESGSPEVTAACFGVPGPVRGGRLRLTNLPWVLDSRELSDHLHIAHVFLINDLEANGYGIPELTSDQLSTLNVGDTSAVGNRAVVSAGTGLGEGILVWNGKTHIPMPSEGGHSRTARLSHEKAQRPGQLRAHRLGTRPPQHLHLPARREENGRAGVARRSHEDRRPQRRHRRSG